MKNAEFIGLPAPEHNLPGGAHLGTSSHLGLNACFCLVHRSLLRQMAQYLAPKRTANSMTHILCNEAFMTKVR